MLFKFLDFKVLRSKVNPLYHKIFDYSMYANNLSYRSTRVNERLDYKPSAALTISEKKAIDEWFKVFTDLSKSLNNTGRAIAKHWDIAIADDGHPIVIEMNLDNDSSEAHQVLRR